MKDGARVLILGINHQIQWARIWSGSRFEEKQKSQFRDLLRRTVAERGILFVGEETKHGEPSIAQEVCLADGPLYRNIEMSPDERRAHQIPNNYENNPGLSREQKESFHQQREEHMFSHVVAEAGNAESILVICGRSHIPGLADRFRKAGHHVQEGDIQAEPWYVEDWNPGRLW